MTESTANESADRAAWQRKLLPFMMAFLSIMTLYFVAETVVQVRRLQGDFRHELPGALDAALKSIDAASAKDSSNAMFYARMRLLASLEADAMQQRHHQTNLMLLSRSWTRYMAFLSGMILVLVGAVFILGKLQEEASEVSIGQKDLSGSIKSTSPGLIMCFLGTLLLIVATSISVSVEMRDAAVFTQGLVVTPVAPVDAGAGAASSETNDDIIMNANPNQ